MIIDVHFCFFSAGPPSKVAKRSESGGSAGGRYAFAAALRSLAQQAGPEGSKEFAGGGGTAADLKEKPVTVAPSPPPPAPKQPSPHPTLSSGFQPYRPDDR